MLNEKTSCNSEGKKRFENNYKVECEMFTPLKVGPEKNRLKSFH
jgi:hypothetical protein